MLLTIKQTRKLLPLPQRALMSKLYFDLSELREKSSEVELCAFEIQSPTAQKHLFILHGLLSQGRNWRSFALNDEIGKRRNSHLLDIRNHGESDHHESMLYAEQAGDVLRYADKKGIEKLTIMGHNVGAKIAMAFACKYPERVDAVISLDTAPRSNANNLKAAEATLNTLN